MSGDVPVPGQIKTRRHRASHRARRSPEKQCSGIAPIAAMEDVDVSRQLKQMTDFIRQEAVEKATEIEIAAAEEFQIEKLQLLEAEKKKIRQEYERKEKQVGIKKKIDYSMQLNASRIKVLQAQDDLVTNMMEATRKELLYTSRDHQAYKRLLRILIVQSLLRLKEPAVVLRCRKEDLELVDSVLESARNEYAERAHVYPPEIVVDRHVYLPSAPSHYQAHGPSCSGGVVMASRDGKIVCENTLDARLQVVFRKKLPEHKGTPLDEQSQSHGSSPTAKHQWPTVPYPHCRAGPNQ
ncbi:hypothetical protein EJB05_32665, partial [Eragrostis curvula]